VSGPANGSGTTFVPSGFTTIKVRDVLIEDATNLIVATDKTFFRVDRGTGARTVLNATQVVDGAQGANDLLTAMAWESPGVVLALIDSFSGSRISRVTLSSMTGTVVSSSTVGTGQTLDAYACGDMYKESSANSLIVSAFSSRTFIRVDLATGNRTLITTLPANEYPISVAPISSTEALVGMYPGAAAPFYRVNLSTGSYTTLPNFSGPGNSRHLDGCAVYSDGSFVAYNNQTAPSPSLVRGSLGGATVTLTTISSNSVGSGPALYGDGYPYPSGLRLVNSSLAASMADSWTMYD
ncbi:MAG: hypothetical protein ABI579_05445, partial [Candidatus Sumerlaeota bacterium]